MTMIVAFVSQKGGVGKSTLSRAFAREALKANLKSKIADLDTQQSTSSDWQRTRENSGHEPRVPVEIYSTASKALADSQSYDLFILDCPARTSKGTLEIAQEADLVIQPTGASLDDLRPAVREFNALAGKGIKRAKLAFALNHIGTPAEEEQTRDYLAESNFYVLKGCLYEKPSYRQAQNHGLSINETRYPALNEKADILIQDIIDRMAEISNG